VPKKTWWEKPLPQAIQYAKKHKIKVIDQFRDKLRFLSNFYYHQGWTAEHRFQAEKALNRTMKNSILWSSSPQAAKRMGNSVPLTPDLVEMWDEAKDMIMKEVLTQKFEIDEMRDLLLSTKDALLIEGNTWHDQYWGDCRCSRHKKTAGQNKLGQLLMEIRHKLAEEEKCRKKSKAKVKAKKLKKK